MICNYRTYFVNWIEPPSRLQSIDRREDSGDIRLTIALVPPHRLACDQYLTAKIPWNDFNHTAFRRDPMSSFQRGPFPRESRMNFDEAIVARSVKAAITAVILFLAGSLRARAQTYKINFPYDVLCDVERLRVLPGGGSACGGRRKGRKT